MVLSVLGSIVAGCGAKEDDAAATAGAATAGAAKDSTPKTADE